jgi:uncharacterized protein (DUF2147 family)
MRQKTCRGTGQATAFPPDGNPLDPLKIGGIGKDRFLTRPCHNIRRTACLRHRPTALLVATVSFFAVSFTMAWARDPQGTWLIDDASAAVQISDCGGTLCGRIVWLRRSRDSEGHLRRDDNNHVPGLRQRPLCGMTVLWGLLPSGTDRWDSGWFYSPDHGTTYQVSAHLQSADTLIARIYLGIPLFGETRALLRVPRATSEGWC